MAPSVLMPWQTQLLDDEIKNGELSEMEAMPDLNHGRSAATC